MSDVNNPNVGLTIDQAVAQLAANREQAQETEQLDNVSVDEVVDQEYEDTLESEEYEEEELESEDDDLEEEGEESEDSEEDDVWEIEVDGETVEVTTEELHKGYLRHNDYTRKRQADAKRAKDLESEYQGKLEQLNQALAQNVSAEQRQYAQLQQEYQRTTDEGQKRDLHYRLLQLQQTINHQAQMNQQAQQLQQQTQQAQFEAYWGEQQDLLRVQYEDWDTKREELKSYLSDAGFEDMSMFAHHKMAELVDKAKQFDELQLKKKSVLNKKIKRKVPKVMKAGQGERQFNANTKKIAELEAQFNRTGSIKDAQALMQARKGN